MTDTSPHPGSAATDSSARVWPPKKKRDLRALWLVGPSLALLAVVIGYPVVRALYLSFQADRHLDPDTDAVDGGFAD